MKEKKGPLSLANAIVIAITLLLFIVALFVKGFTHDLILEAAVFLVSVKLILATHQIRYQTKRVEGKLDNILNAIKKDPNVK